MSSPRYGRSEKRNTERPFLAASTAAATPADEPPTTNPSTLYATGMERPDSTTSSAERDDRTMQIARTKAKTVFLKSHHSLILLLYGIYL